jgi:hypothetical protein
MNDHDLSPETLPEMLHRHHATDTSIEAAESIDVSRLEQMILEDIELAGVWGMTQDDLLAMHPRHSYSSVTARPASLKRKGLIYDSGERRLGKSGRRQAVLKATKFQALENNDRNDGTSSSTPVQ